MIDSNIQAIDSVGDPPLPIPNREVKPDSADGTAFSCGRVGHRHFFFKQGLSYKLRPFFVIVGIFIQLFGGWKAKLYDCPFSKRDEQRSALRRELTGTHVNPPCQSWANGTAFSHR